MSELKDSVLSEVISLHKHSQIAAPDVTILPVADRLHTLGAMQTQLTLESGCIDSFLYVVSPMHMT